MRRFWFVRHGESVANAEGWLAGFHDADLTPRGVSQARALRADLAEIRPERLLASDLTRARRTAELGFPHAAPRLECHEGLRERNVGAWERVPMRSLRDQGHMNTLLTWAGRPPAGESQRDLAARVLAWLAEHDDGRETMAFVHGGLIRVVVGLLDGTPVDQIGRWKVPNVEVVARDVPSSRWAELLEALP